MYIVPKQPTSSKKETVYFVAGFMLQDIIVFSHDNCPGSAQGV